VFYLYPLLTLAALVLCVRRGKYFPWIFIIFFLPGIGAILYLAVELFGLLPQSLGERRQSPRLALDRARSDATRVDSAGAWTELAALALDRGRPGEAAAAAERALAKRPDDFDARYLLGRARLGAGDAMGALEPLAATVAAKPDHDTGDAAFAYANALRASGDLAGARRELEQLAERSSRADILFTLAELQLATGAKEAARTTFQRIVDEWVFVPKFMRSRVRPWVWRAHWRLWRLGG
jgi:hypothetical protein